MKALLAIALLMLTACLPKPKPPACDDLIAVDPAECCKCLASTEFYPGGPGCFEQGEEACVSEYETSGIVTTYGRCLQSPECKSVCVAVMPHQNVPFQ